MGKKSSITVNVGAMKCKFLGKLNMVSNKFSQINFLSSEESMVKKHHFFGEFYVHSVLNILRIIYFKEFFTI